MKTYSKILFLILLIILTFSACNLEDNNSEPTNDTGTSQEYTESDKLLDNELFQFASSNNDAESCNKIISEDLKNECEKTVNASIVTVQAVENRDLKLCDGIDLPRFKDYCVLATTKEIDAYNETREKIERKKAMSELEQKAIDEGNVNLCDQQENEDKKVTCKYNILTNQALNNKDSSLCDQIGDESLIEHCKSLVDSR
ncbi:hypothetical protein GF354_04315 [Candidatus Peregrinibacteria bacterium]|nr:hypothetical protein [Candidatus Peregrinibacteria bacterium]